MYEIRRSRHFKKDVLTPTKSGSQFERDLERISRSLNYEEVYPADYDSIPHARQGIGHWIHFYDHEKTSKP